MKVRLDKNLKFSGVVLNQKESEEYARGPFFAIIFAGIGIYKFLDAVANYASYEYPYKAALFIYSIAVNIAKFAIVGPWMVGRSISSLEVIPYPNLLMALAIVVAVVLWALVFVVGSFLARTSAVSVFAGLMILPAIICGFWYVGSWMFSIKESPSAAESPPIAAPMQEKPVAVPPPQKPTISVETEGKGLGSETSVPNDNTGQQESEKERCERIYC